MRYALSRIFVKALFIGVFLLVSLFFISSKGIVKSCDNVCQKNQEIEQLEAKLKTIQKEANTLSNQVAQFNAQIRLTELKISQTQEKILMLGGRIDQLEISLEALSTAFSSRAVATYKMARNNEAVFLLISSGNINQAVSRFHYLQKIQIADHDLLVRLQKAQNSYKEDKSQEETLQIELEKQKISLDTQKKAKAQLLAVTRNDEKKYQQLLASARAELAVILGQGKESFLRNVNEGDIIGRAIPSASGCSSGQHLHFEIHQGSNIKDPNDFLRQISFSYSYDSSWYGYYGTISPRGNWNWPMSEPVVINQGYGSHGFAQKFYSGGIHRGIDMDSTSSTNIKAVKSGKLYGGSYRCEGQYPGTLLYAKVDHGDGYTSWYLHITPQ